MPLGEELRPVFLRRCCRCASWPGQGLRSQQCSMTTMVKSCAAVSSGARRYRCRSGWGMRGRSEPMAIVGRLLSDWVPTCWRRELRKLVPISAGRRRDGYCLWCSTFGCCEPTVSVATKYGCHASYALHVRVSSERALAVWLSGLKLRSSLRFPSGLICHDPAACRVETRWSSKMGSGYLFLTKLFLCMVGLSRIFASSLCTLVDLSSINQSHKRGRLRPLLEVDHWARKRVA